MAIIQQSQFIDDPIIIEYDATRNAGDTVVSIRADLRFVIHRQKLGMFTPMTMDTLITWAIPQSLPVNFPNLSESNIKYHQDKATLPFRSGGLFVDDSSEFLVELLTGPEAGYNRKTQTDAITAKVAGGEFWVSSNYTPPPTKQNQLVVVYDVANLVHGSFLSPINVMRYITTTTQALTGARLMFGEIQRGFGTIVP